MANVGSWSGNICQKKGSLGAGSRVDTVDKEAWRWQQQGDVYVRPVELCVLRSRKLGARPPPPRRHVFEATAVWARTRGPFFPANGRRPPGEGLTNERTGDRAPTTILGAWARFRANDVCACTRGILDWQDCSVGSLNELINRSVGMQFLQDSKILRIVSFEDLYASLVLKQIISTCVGISNVVHLQSPFFTFNFGFRSSL